MRPSTYRLAVRNTVAAEARAYGFSLVVLTDGYLCVDEHRLPGHLGALSYLGGVLLSQALIAAFAFRRLGVTWSTGEDVEYRAVVSVHVLSVIAGVLAGWGIAALVHAHDLAYFLCGLGGLTVYQLALAAELALGMRR
jgi:hypothetical protein